MTELLQIRWVVVPHGVDPPTFALEAELDFSDPVKGDPPRAAAIIRERIVGHLPLAVASHLCDLHNAAMEALR